LFKPIRWILLVYGLLCGIFYTYQQHFFFQPKALENQHKYQFVEGIPYTESKLPFDSATVIDVIRFLPKDSIKGVVLFFHGNRSNVEHYSQYAPYFTKNGYECWMPDYPGFGRSTGEMNIEVLQKLSIQLYKMARAKYAPGQIVIYGKSLGTGIAAYLASERDCRHLILETPYYSLASVAANYMYFMPVHRLIKYNLDTYQYFDNVPAPITVIQGNKDQLIPLTNAASLISHMKKTDAFYIIRNGTHNNLPEFPKYREVIDSVMKM
jgi:pimeloyl-ACP methyl ester carboxylesterase